MPRSPIVQLITTTSPVSRYHSLSLWIITLKCPLSSFNPWLRAPSVLMVFRGRRGDVWWWAVTCCIRSSQLMYLVRPVPTVCRLETLISMKLLGASCWKPGPVPSSLCSARFSSKSPSFFTLDNSYYDTTGTTHNNYNSDNRQWQGYLTINFIQFIYLWTIITQNQIPMRYTSDFPILPHYPPGTPRSLSKSNPTDGFAFAWGRTNPNCLP